MYNAWERVLFLHNSAISTEFGWKIIFYYKIPCSQLLIDMHREKTEWESKLLNRTWWLLPLVHLLGYREALWCSG